MNSQDQTTDHLRELCAGRRVAYVCADPGIGVFGTKGASVHVQAVVRSMLRAGAQVEIFAAKTGGKAPADLADVPVHALPTKAKPDGAVRKASTADRERWLIERDDEAADIIAAAGPFDLHYQRYSLFSAAPAERARAAGTPVIIEVNAPLIDEQAAHRTLVHTSAAHERLLRVAAAADLAVCVSEPVRTWLLANAPHTHAVVVPNGADVHRITPSAQPFTSGAPVTIGFLGTLKPWHGVDVLLEAAAPLLRHTAAGFAARLLIVGDGPLASDLDARAADLGITDRVERTGAVDPTEVPELLQRMDIGLAPYPVDAGTYFSPLKVLEYLAAGLPVVASAVGQLPELVEHEHTGLLVPPSDVVALRQAIARLITSPALRTAYGVAGRDRAVARHSWDRTVADTLRALAPRTTAGHDLAAAPAPKPGAGLNVDPDRAPEVAA